MLCLTGVLLSMLGSSCLTGVASKAVLFIVLMESMLSLNKLLLHVLVGVDGREP